MSALTQYLESHITDRLRDFQAGTGRDDVKSALIDLVNLDEPPYVTLNFALMRMAAVHTEIRNALDSGQLYAWVSPRLAAMAFEGVFEACLGVWLAAPEPADPLQLQPSVQRFVRWQVRMFAASIGDR